MINLIDEIIYSNKKSISIAVDISGKVVCRVPNFASERDVNKFLESKKQWIIENKRKQIALHSKYDDILTNKVICYLGKLYEINYTECKCNTFIVENIINTQSFKSIIIWLKKQANLLLTSRIEYLSNILNISNFTYKIDNAKSRWGACNSRREIKLNFRLICLREEMIDFVILHEMMHLKYMNHSKQFWDELQAIFPTSNKCKKEIKEYSFLMKLYR